MESHGIFCLSTDPRNILMWSHYGQHHKGIALQFEYARDPVNFSYTLPINYSNRYPAINYFAGREDYSTLVLRKYCDWAYEKEWRLVKNESAETYHSFCHEALTGVILGCSANGPDSGSNTGNDCREGKDRSRPHKNIQGKPTRKRVQTGYQQ